MRDMRGGGAVGEGRGMSRGVVTRLGVGATSYQGPGPTIVRLGGLSAEVVDGAFMNFFPCNHIINIKKFFFRQSKRQRNFSLFFFAS